VREKVSCFSGFATRLYRLRQRWLECLVGNKSFYLYGQQNSCFHQLPEEEQRWLHQELDYIRRQAKDAQKIADFSI